MKAGGVVEHHQWELEVECLPADVPDAIEADISALEIGMSLRVSDLVAPKGATILTNPDELVVAVAQPQMALDQTGERLRIEIAAIEMEDRLRIFVLGQMHKSEHALRFRLKADTPDDMILLACLGPSRCEREFRALSCRQFPFFPYVTSNYRFLGLAYEWEFESKCWVISNLSEVTQKYRNEFIQTYDRLFSLFQDEFENYADHSEKLRDEFVGRKRRFPLLHRNGRTYLVSPATERLSLVDADELPTFAPYA